MGDNQGVGRLRAGTADQRHPTVTDVFNVVKAVLIDTGLQSLHVIH